MYWLSCICMDRVGSEAYTNAKEIQDQYLVLTIFVNKILYYHSERKQIDIEKLVWKAGVDCRIPTPSRTNQITAFSSGPF
jgi:hypothetical protein